VTTRVIASFAARPEPVPAPELATLTGRERDVLELLVRGLSNAEIGGRLLVGEATVRTHVGRIFQKLGLRDRIQAVVYGYEAGLVRPGATGLGPAG
jgi:DNA-binding NarL/FixJ family response regulator